MIWIVGNKGMLGQELEKLLKDLNLQVTGTDRELDFTSLETVMSWAQEKKPEWIINCAAYTAVDKAEDEADLAHRLNVVGPENLGKVATVVGAKVLHISTDYVFDGKGITVSDGTRRPYQEEDLTGPTGVYGRTKEDGEKALLAASNQTVILRTAWLYGAHGPNFVYTMLRLMKEREGLGVIADQWGSPTWALDLSQAICEIVQSQKPVYGVFHFSGGGQCSWYDFAQEIHRLGLVNGLLTRDCTINSLTTAQYPTKAQRPSWSVLDKTKIQQTYGVKVPDWKQSLEKWFEIEKQKEYA